jgi:hypothetical protein
MEDRSNAWEWSCVVILSVQVHKQRSLNIVLRDPITDMSGAGMYHAFVEPDQLRRIQKLPGFQLDISNDYTTKYESPFVSTIVPLYRVLLSEILDAEKVSEKIAKKDATKGAKKSAKKATEKVATEAAPDSLPAVLKESRLNLESSKRDVKETGREGHSSRLTAQTSKLADKVVMATEIMRLIQNKLGITPPNPLYVMQGPDNY